MLKKADIFPTNPKWSIEGREQGSTWKTLLITLLVLAAGVFLSLGDIVQLWCSKSNLSIVQSSLSSQGQPVSPLTMGVRLNNAAAYSLLNMEYLNGDKASRTSCPRALTNIDANMVCFQTRECMFNTTDNVMIYTNSSSTAVMTLYVQLFSLTPKIQDQELPFKRIDVTAVATITNISITKQKLMVYNSLIPGANSENYVGAEYDYVAAFTTSSTMTNRVRFFSDDGTNMPIYIAIRQTFPTIIANFVSNIQLLTGIVGIIMIMMNALSLKVELAKQLYTNTELHTVRVSYMFTIKHILLSGFTMLKLHRCFLRRGWFHQQFICNLAFEDMDEKMSVENILKYIQTIRQNKLVELPTEKKTEASTEILNFDYNLLLDSDTPTPAPEDEAKPKSEVDPQAEATPQADLQADPKIKAESKLLASRSSQKKSWFGNLLRSMDSSSAAVEFEVEKERKSSHFSVVVTYIGIGGLIFLLIFLNTFSMEPNVTTYYQYENKTSILNASLLQPIVFTIRRSNTKVAYPNITAVNLTASVTDELGNSYNLQRNCSRVTFPQVPTRMYGVCVSDNPSISPSSDILIRISKVGTVNLAYQLEIGMLQYYMRKSDMASRYRQFNYTQSASNSLAILVLILEKTVIITNGVASEYFQLMSMKIFVNAFPTPTDYITYRIRLSDRVRYRIISNVTMSDLFFRLWSINLVFFIILALYISKPYNHRIAKKVFGERFTDDTKKQMDKGEEILRINKLLLYLRSKMDTVDDNLFFKEHLALPKPESETDQQINEQASNNLLQSPTQR